MKRISICLVLMICLGCPVFAQTARNSRRAKDAEKVRDAKTKKMLQAAADKGTSVSVKNLSVNDNVRAQAVLIPQVDARRIFGKEIADNYAVIQLVVGNKSDDAALIIHGIFIDYSNWPLSGSNKSSIAGDSPVKERDKPFQTSTDAHHIASEEYRIVRGQLLEAQNWTWRNLTLRALTFAGSLAGAGGFAFNKTENTLIAALNGNLPSGFATLFPDSTLEQLKRVDDFGYHTNKVVAQQDSEIIICFFPIDRFLTPGFRKLYLKSPALFFSPLQMLVDKKIQSDVEEILGKDLGTDVPLDELKKALPCYLRIGEQRKQGRFLTTLNSDDKKQAASSTSSTTDDSQTIRVDSINEAGLDLCLAAFGLKIVNDKIDVKNEDMFKRFLILDYLAATSLNKVTVVVDGVMTVDTTGIAAKIDGVEFDPVANCGDDKTQCFWTDLDAGGGVRTGTIRGSYQTGGSIKITEAEDLGITEIKTISEGSSDQVLNFSFKLTKSVDTGKKLHFIVSKPTPGNTDAKTKDSLPWEYEVHYTFNGPTITKAELDDNQNILTITGSKLSGSENNPLVVTLRTPDDEDVEVKPKSPITATKLVIDIPADKKVAGCWSVKVKVGEKVAFDDSMAESDHNSTFVITPSPKLESATLKEEKIVVKGKDLIDTKADCGKGKKLTFLLVRQGFPPIPLTPPDSPSSTEWSFDVPSDAKRIRRTAYTVKIQLDGKDVLGSGPVELQKP